MSLPVYQHFDLKDASAQDLIDLLLQNELNLKQPIVINLKALNLDEQREMIGLIENYFTSNNISYKFPYPVILVSDHESSITKISLVDNIKELPKFYGQRETKMNIKETHLANKNKLLQQDVKNCDNSTNIRDIENYGFSHRIIYELEHERKFYRSILNQLVKMKKNG
jgi:hypothetical protein